MLHVRKITNKYQIMQMTTSHDEEWNYPMIEGCPATLEVTPEGVTLTFESK